MTALTDSLSVFYDDKGKPTAALKTILTHFKDRFREAIKAVGSSSVKPKTETFTTSQGSMVRLTATMPEGERPLSREAFYRLEDRMVTPSMSKLGVEDAPPGDGRAAFGPSWGELLKNRAEPLVVSSFHSEGGTVSLSSALLFHHPDDEAASRLKTRAPDEALPAKDLRFALKDGTDVLIGQQTGGLNISDKGAVIFGDVSTFVLYDAWSFSDAYDPRWVQMAEAAGSASATGPGLKNLAQRLKLKPGASTMRDALLAPSSQRAALQSLGETLAQDVAKRIVEFYGFGEETSRGFWELRMEAEDVDVVIAFHVVWDPSRGMNNRWPMLRMNGSVPGTYVNKGQDWFLKPKVAGNVNLMNPREAAALTKQFADEALTRVAKFVDLLNHLGMAELI